ncbi:hypothetical protein [Nitratireductor basaltis]|uniref:Uncharacterized protein n=1 Tax=Nitratireductor basaltis TaxID=472175 RepID=A0A084UBM8_9HYPH|nr:hypothetical protein [Nitratireductor basaltis]KFB10364.1 hypothetical protein EL18_01395 [Nitratireductor basaltis]
MSWNFDLSAAPKGKPIQREVKRKGEVVLVDDFQHQKIIAAGRCGVVTVSRWLPEEGRWEMFTKEHPPIAWQPWPEHPEAGAAA